MLRWMQDAIAFRLRPALTNEALNALFSSGWPEWQSAPDGSDWQPVLARSLAYACAFVGERVIGFVNVAWDGRDHAFLLDPRVAPESVRAKPRCQDELRRTRRAGKTTISPRRAAVRPTGFGDQGRDTRDDVRICGAFARSPGWNAK